MIALEFNPAAFASADPAIKAGAEAERQMAHYLDREFGRDKDIFVFHGLRIPLGQGPAGRSDAVQIDHLIVHRYGMVIVESKSVLTEVKVNSRGEWMRKWNRRWQGWPSPVEQARRQGEALRNLLQEHRDQIRGKLLGLLQTTFRCCPIELRVGISEKALIHRDSAGDAPEVMKADQICREVRERIETHRYHGSLLGMIKEKPRADNAGVWSMKPEELERLRAFLLQQHTPLSASAATPESVPQQAVLHPVAQPEVPPRVAAPSPGSIAKATPPVNADAPEERLEALTCRKCNSINVQVVYRRDYCLLCAECEGYTPLDYTCTRCAATARVQKRGDTFSRNCPCGANIVFFRNAAAAGA